jgi:hypothetical protein
MAFVYSIAASTDREAGFVKMDMGRFSPLGLIETRPNPDWSSQQGVHSISS